MIDIILKNINPAQNQNYYYFLLLFLFLVILFMENWIPFLIVDATFHWTFSPAAADR